MKKRSPKKKTRARPTPRASLQDVASLVETVRRLRAPGGCPWDRDQTHRSLRPFLIEESYEWLDILDEIHDDKDLARSPRLLGGFREEAGDVLLQVVLHAQLARETGATSFYEIAKALNEKLIRRHPHVFGEAKAHSVESAYARWEAQKAQEKKANPGAAPGTLEGVPRSLPALLRASRTIEKVTRVGFQWPDFQGPLAKVDEEIAELKRELTDLESRKKAGQPVPAELQAKVQGELGDVLFTVANVAFLSGANPEDALRSTLDRFARRFRHVEARLAQSGRKPSESNLAEMDQFWNEAKELERITVYGLTGGIASGKSTAARLFAESGIPVIDADQIAKEVSKPGQPGHAALLRIFGTDDRQKIRDLAFQDPAKKTELEAVMHPLIQAASMDRFLQLAREGRKIAIYEASLLVETGRHRDFAGLIVVTAPRARRIERLVRRDRISQALARRIMAQQADDEIKKRVAQFVLENDGTPKAFASRVAALARTLLESRG